MTDIKPYLSDVPPTYMENLMKIIPLFREFNGQNPAIWAAHTGTNNMLFTPPPGHWVCFVVLDIFIISQFYKPRFQKEGWNKFIINFEFEFWNSCFSPDLYKNHERAEGCRYVKNCSCFGTHFHSCAFQLHTFLFSLNRSWLLCKNGLA